MFCLPGEAEHSGVAGEKTRARIRPPPLILCIPPPPRLQNFPFPFALFLRLIPQSVTAAGVIGGVYRMNTLQIIAYSILCHNKIPNIQHLPALSHSTPSFPYSTFFHCTLSQPSLASTLSTRLSVAFMGSIVVVLSLL